MGKLYDHIPPDLAHWIGEQHVFFVATAPLARDGHVNCSPKGLDSFRIFSPEACGYLDLTGSGAETIAHVRENGRITLMFCSFSDTPRIVRVYGRGEVHRAGSARHEALAPNFPSLAGARSILTVDVERVMTSCGYGVPISDAFRERETLVRSCEKMGPEGARAYQALKNRRSIDDLPAL